MGPDLLRKRPFAHALNNLLRCYFRLARHPEGRSRQADFPVRIWRASKERVCRYQCDTAIRQREFGCRVAYTRGDEAVSVFIDHAKTLIEQGGPMALLCARPKDFWPQYNPTRSTAAQTKKSKTTKKEDTMTQTSATQQGREQADDKNAIRPFPVNVPEADLTELRRRINATKWPERETVTAFQKRCGRASDHCAK